MSESPETAAPAQPEPPSTPGKGYRVGEYTIVETLGHGSMATVYLARDGTGHEVALKLFQEGPGVSPTMLERFRREAEASKKLRRHPNIMKVYATGQHGSLHYIVMEPIRNSRTLEDLIEAGRLDTEQILQVVAKIARALHYAHSRNIVHRDVKPSNVMIDEFGEPLLTDFGVAALIDWPSFTLSGALTGTPLYMSPEQARADKVGPAGDIYSLGVVLYEALTGVLPYSTQHSAPVKNVLEAVKNELPRRPRFYRKDLSPELEAVILKALQKEPERRYADAEEFADDIDRARTGRQVSARLASTSARLWTAMRRYDQFVVAAAVMLAMAIGGWVYFRQKLMAARYEKLLSTVHLRNFVLRVTDQAPDTTEASPGSIAWHEIRNARRAMNAGNWETARDTFVGAVEMCRRNGDRRTEAMAMLDLARCQLLLGSAGDALDLIRSILRNDDASSIVLSFAHLEGVQLALIGKNQEDAVAILQMRPLPSDGPLRAALRCLAGEVPAAEFERDIERAPPRLRNDLRFALAVRRQLDGDEAGRVAELRRVLQSSLPGNEWPAPWAKNLLSTARDS